MYGNPNMTKLSNSNIASAKVQRSNYPKYQECKRSIKQQYCKCNSPKAKPPKISRVQKVDKTAILQEQKLKGQTTQNIKSGKGRQKLSILQVQKSKGQTTQNIKSAKVENQILQVLLTFAIFAPAIFGFRPFALLICWVV